MRNDPERIAENAGYTLPPLEPPPTDNDWLQMEEVGSTSVFWPVFFGVFLAQVTFTALMFTVFLVLSNT